MNSISYLLVYSFLINTLLLSSNNRCVHSYSDIRSRPELSTFYISQEGHFQIHYDTDGVNAPSLDDQNSDDIPDYVESVAQIAEESRYNLIDVMGYLEEPDDGDGLYDIYIVNQSAWGWNVVENTNTGTSYVKIDNDYSGNHFESDYCLNDLDKMRISVVHEYFHAIQRAYRPNPTTDHDFLLEMSSMWLEDLIVPECNDYLSFVDALSYSIFNNPTQKFDGSDLTSSQSQANFGYSMALFPHYLVSLVEGLDNPFDSVIVRKIWEEYASGVSARDAIIHTIENDFDDSFPRVWSDFISSNMFCGYFNYFNQDFYFYADQQYIDPISINPSDYVFSNEEELYAMTLEPYSVNILTLGIMDNMLSESFVSDFDSFQGYISIIGPSDKLHAPVSENLMQLNLNSGDRFSIILSPVLSETDISLFFETTDLPNSEITISDVYPNPSFISENMNINIQNNFDIYDFRIEFYNISGKLISKYLYDSSISQGSSSISLPISKYISASGVYFLVFLDGNDKVFVQKIAFIK